ncbi:MAG TPA: hypothetical protein PL181_17180 [bacterium]|nr:hypothetical protein [bacterium]
MADNIHVFAVGRVASGAVLDAANGWSSNLNISFGPSPRDQKLTFERSTYVCFTIERRILFMGLNKGFYSPTQPHHIEATGLFLDSLPAEIYALGAPWAAYRPTGAIIRTLDAFNLACQNRFCINLTAHVSSERIPVWLKAELKRQYQIIHWITGDKAYPDVELELYWRRNGSVDNIVFSNRQLCCFKPLHYSWQRNLPIIFNGTQNITTDCAILASIQQLKMYGMVAFSGLPDGGAHSNENQRLTEAYLDVLSNSDSLTLVVNKRGLEQLFAAMTSSGSGSWPKGLSTAKKLAYLWASRRKPTYRRLFFISKQIWLAIDERGDVQQLNPEQHLNCPDEDYLDVVAGLIFAFELEFRTGKKHNQVGEILSSCANLLSNDNIKKLF